MIPAVGTPEHQRFRIAQRLRQDPDAFGMTPAVRDDMIARLWSTGIMDTVDIAMACRCRESTVQRTLHRQREARHAAP